MERNGFVFFLEYYQSIKELPKNQQLAALWAVIEKGLFDADPVKLPPSARAMWVFLAPRMEAYATRYENGRSGGRPRKTASSATAENGQKTEDDHAEETALKTRRKKTEAKPNENRTETEAKPKGENIKHKTQNIKPISYPLSPLPPSPETRPAETDGRTEEKEREKMEEQGNAAVPAEQPTEVDVGAVRRLCRRYGVDEDDFVATYAAREWRIGGEPIRDMEALIRRCADNARKRQSQPRAPAARSPESSSFDADEFMAAALRRTYGEDVEI